MTRILRPIAMVTLIGTLSGCGTTSSLFDSREPTKIYAGTRASANSHGAVLDTPFSLALDTALLPITVPWTVLNRLFNKHAGQPENRAVATERQRHSR